MLTRKIHRLLLRYLTVAGCLGLMLYGIATHDQNLIDAVGASAIVLFVILLHDFGSGDLGGQ